MMKRLNIGTKKELISYYYKISPNILQKKKLTAWCWHLPIFTPRRQSTIFGTTELNFRVRYGNGWTLCVIDTN